MKFFQRLVSNDCGYGHRQRFTYACGVCVRVRVHLRERVRLAVFVAVSFRLFWCLSLSQPFMSSILS